MNANLALDIAVAVEYLRRAYEDEAEGRDPVANYQRSRAAVAPKDASVALGLAVDALLRATKGDLGQLIDALWLGAEARDRRRRLHDRSRPTDMRRARDMTDEPEAPTAPIAATRPWTPIAPLAPWRAYGRGTIPVAVRRLGDRVEVRGAVCDGIRSAPIFQLPRDCRPPGLTLCPLAMPSNIALRAPGCAIAAITAAGNITVETDYWSTRWFDLSSISFAVDDQLAETIREGKP